MDGGFPETIMLNSTTALHDMVDDKCKKQEITFLPAGKEVFFASDVAGKVRILTKCAKYLTKSTTMRYWI